MVNYGRSDDTRAVDGSRGGSDGPSFTHRHTTQYTGATEADSADVHAVAATARSNAVCSGEVFLLRKIRSPRSVRRLRRSECACTGGNAGSSSAATADEDFAMNRREAVAALVNLPSVARIVKVADLQPDDVIVVECDALISNDTADRIKGRVQDVWPGRKIIVVGPDVRLKVMPGSEATHA